VLCFAILGAPRTSRQSREMSLIMTILAVGALRLTGFVCNVVATQNGIAVVVQYGSIVLALGAGFYAIARGVVIEPPAFLTQPIASLFERFSRRLAPST
jgi:lipopolysaccharide export system permease protein